MTRGHVPIRLCIGCRTRRPKSRMIHLKIDGDKIFMAPPKDRSVGRGCYVCPREKCLEEALRKGNLEKAFRMSSVICPAKEELLRRLEKKG